MTIEFDSSVRISGAVETDVVTFGVESTTRIDYPGPSPWVIYSNFDRLIEKRFLDYSINDIYLSGNYEKIAFKEDVGTLTENKFSFDVPPISATVNGYVSNSFNSKGFSLSGDLAFVNSGKDNAIQFRVLSFAPGSLRAHLMEQVVDAFADATSETQKAAVFYNNVAMGNGTTVDAFKGSYGGVNVNNLTRISRGRYVAPPLDILDQMLDNNNSTGWKAWITPHHYLSWKGHSQLANSPNYRQIMIEIAVEYSATRWNGSLCKLFPKHLSDWMISSATMQMTSIIPNHFPAFARLFNTYDGLESSNPAAAKRRLVQPCDFRNEQPLSAIFGLDGIAQYQYRATNGDIITGGDSGSPIWTVVNGGLVPLGTVSFAGYMGYYPFHTYFEEIQQAVSEMNASGDFIVQAVDMTPFTRYNQSNWAAQFPKETPQP